MKVYEGTVVACDAANSVFAYLVEDGGRIVFVGDDLPGPYRDAPREHLGSRALLPCFADTHIHFSGHALFAAGLDIRHAGTIVELQDTIRETASRSRDKVLVGFGASAHSVRENRLITRRELDEACPDRPVFLMKYDGHACVVNTRLMKKMSGRISRLRGFHPESGEMKQEAFFAITDSVSKSVSLPRTVRNMLQAVDAMAAQGIGLMHSVSGVGYPLDLDVDMERFFARGLSNPFQMRVYFQTMDVRKILKRKLPRVGGCFATALDGCLGSEDAALFSPYRNDPNNCGVLFYTDEQVMRFTGEAHRAGLQIEMHAIGDAAFDQAVRAFATAIEDVPREDHRHTIIHGCMPTRDALARCAELGISIALQPSFLHWNLEPLQFLEDTIGDRAYQLSPLKDMIDMGIVLSGGSDAPCTLPDPIFGIWAACNHYVPEQSVTVQDALKMFTWNGAWTSFDEQDRGSLEVGKVADMVMLNRDPPLPGPGRPAATRGGGTSPRGKALRAGPEFREPYPERRDRKIKSTRAANRTASTDRNASQQAAVELEDRDRNRFNPRTEAARSLSSCGGSYRRRASSFSARCSEISIRVFTGMGVRTS